MRHPLLPPNSYPPMNEAERDWSNQVSFGHLRLSRAPKGSKDTVACPREHIPSPRHPNHANELQAVIDTLRKALK